MSVHYEIYSKNNIYFGILINNFLEIGELKSKIVRVKLMIKNRTIHIIDINSIHEYYRDFYETREVIQVALQMAINLFDNIKFKYVKFIDCSHVFYHIDLKNSIMYKNRIDRQICAFGTANLSDLTFLLYGCSWYQFMIPYLSFKYEFNDYNNYKKILYIYKNFNVYKNLNNDNYKYPSIMQSFNIDVDYKSSNSWAEFLFKKSYKVNEICVNIVNYLYKILNIKSMVYSKWYAKIYNYNIIDIEYIKINSRFETIIEKPYYYNLISKWNPLKIFHEESELLYQAISSQSIAAMTLLF